MLNSTIRMHGACKFNCKPEARQLRDGWRAIQVSRILGTPLDGMSFRLRSSHFVGDKTVERFHFNLWLDARRNVGCDVLREESIQLVF